MLLTAVYLEKFPKVAVIPLLLIIYERTFQAVAGCDFKDLESDRSAGIVTLPVRFELIHGLVPPGNRICGLSLRPRVRVGRMDQPENVGLGRPLPGDGRVSRKNAQARCRPDLLLRVNRSAVPLVDTPGTVPKHVTAMPKCSASILQFSHRLGRHRSRCRVASAIRRKGSARSSKGVRQRSASWIFFSAAFAVSLRPRRRG